MTRYEWDAKYALIMSKDAGIDYADAVTFAEAADDEYSEGMTPKEAVDAELSYWAEG